MTPLGASTPHFEPIVLEARKAVKESKLAGAVLYIGLDGREKLFEAVGWRDKEAKARLKKDDLFKIYSATKTLTGVVVMQLVEEGKISLDTPVADIFPEIGRMKVGCRGWFCWGTQAQDRAMTMRHLLTHTSGIIYPWWPDKISRQWAAAGLNGPFDSTADFMQKLCSVPLASQPGTHFNYSLSLDLAGAVIEKLEGKSLGQCMAQRLFKPLGMVNTSFSAGKELQGRLSADYSYKNGVIARSDKPAWQDFEDPGFHSGGGGLISSAADLARFYAMLAGRGKLGDVRILKEETLLEMLKNQVEGVDMRGGQWMGAGEGSMGLAFNRVPARQTGTMSYGWAGFSGTSGFFDLEKNLYAVLMVHIYDQTPQIRFREAFYDALAFNAAP
jgi:CubicO group peptidase (beta-lactamase class C family)